MDLNVTEYEQFIDMVWDSTFQLTFKKLPLVGFLYSNKEKYAQLPKKAGKMLPPFQVILIDMKMQLSPIKPDIKKVAEM